MYRSDDRTTSCDHATTRLEKVVAWLSENAWTCIGLAYLAAISVAWVSGLSTRVPRSALPEGHVQNHSMVAALGVIVPSAAAFVTSLTSEDGKPQSAARAWCAALALHWMLMAVTSGLVEMFGP